MYDTILVATDGSDPSEAAVDHALDLAKQYGATLHALTVVDTRVYTDVDIRATPVFDALEEQAQETVDAVAEAGAAVDVPVVTAVEHGSPASAIVDYATGHDVDVVVVGTHGRRGVRRVVLGSVAERVVRNAPVPVLTVRDTESETDDASRPR
ncbi:MULTISPECIES: universal stress protein [Haloprofundus]|uniref:universal stress protein n=1 Tax=Haloprofundus TaxID=1911573 RepID=UPI000E443743|nr:MULTISPECIES: universal stress protein [Haloprofundus]QCJ45808.1 universal stress protein [Haloprofundus sp. MHR1]